MNVVAAEGRRWGRDAIRDVGKVPGAYARESGRSRVVEGRRSVDPDDRQPTEPEQVDQAGLVRRFEHAQHWVRDYAAALRPYSAPGGYINFMDGDDLPRVAENYGENYKRLREVKAKYDPQNLFHVNQNIAPA